MRIERYWLSAYKLCALASIASSLKDAVLVNSACAVEKQDGAGQSEQYASSRFRSLARKQITVTTAFAARCSSAN